MQFVEIFLGLAGVAMGAICALTFLRASRRPTFVAEDHARQAGGRRTKTS